MPSYVYPIKNENKLVSYPRLPMRVAHTEFKSPRSKFELSKANTPRSLTPLNVGWAKKEASRLVKTYSAVSGKKKKNKSETVNQPPPPPSTRKMTLIERFIDGTDVDV